MIMAVCCCTCILGSFLLIVHVATCVLTRGSKGRRTPLDLSSPLTISVLLQYGSLSGPFGPVLDGPDGLLPKTPAELRKGNDVMKVNILAGVTRDEGAYIAGGALWYGRCAFLEKCTFIYRCCCKLYTVDSTL